MSEFTAEDVRSKDAEDGTATAFASAHCPVFGSAVNKLTYLPRIKNKNVPSETGVFEMLA